ncbi:MAG: hypothetical protein K2M75_01545 [Clostridia bacterium]|nr:hypothetical protein [Clostridia bacterium]
MKQNNSAIMQMMMGERGNLDEFHSSDEYKKAFDDLFDKIEEFQKHIADNPKLLKEFIQLQDAHLHETVLYAYDVYREAFAFGLAMVQEVFGNKE